MALFRRFFDLQYFVQGAAHYSSPSGGHVADHVNGMDGNNEIGRLQTPKIEESNEDGKIDKLLLIDIN